MARTFLTIVFVLTGAFASAQQLPNPSFEEWADTAQTRPAGWTVSPYGAGRSSDAAVGESAISIWNWYCYVEGTLRATNIPFPRSAEGVFHLTGNYKYILGENGASDTGTDDSAIVTLVLKRWNAASQSSDTVAITTAALGPTSEYKYFDIALPYNEIADSLEIEFRSSAKGFCASVDCNCCYLTLDGLGTGITGSVNGEKEIPADPAIPNPFTAETLLGTAPPGGCRLNITTLDGVLIRDQHFSAGEQMIVSGEHLVSGTYVYRIINERETKVGKVIKQ